MLNTKGKINTTQLNTIQSLTTRYSTQCISYNVLSTTYMMYSKLKLTQKIQPACISPIYSSSTLQIS